MRPEEIKALASIISGVGTDSLGSTIDSGLRRKVKFDMSCAFLFGFNHDAIVVHDGYGGSIPEQTLSSYVRGGYLLDPFYVACMNGHPAGLWRMSALAPDSFFSSGFAISKDIHPCVSSEHGTSVDEVGFIVPIRPQLAVVYSLMKYADGGPFQKWEMQELAAITPIITSAFELHCRINYNEVIVNPERADIEMEDAFMGMMRGQLTDAQRQVAKLILQGHSSASIASRLRISDGTVKVHKHNIYQRLNISTNAELFRLFINYLAKAS